LYLSLDPARSFDLTLLGRIAVDFNPLDGYKTLAESAVFRKYLGGSPANIAIGLARLGKKCGFFARVSDDQFGDFVTGYFKHVGIDTERIRRCENGEKIGLTFTEMLSETESSILMYRNKAADLQLCPDDIDEAYIKSSKMLLISGTALAAGPSREAALKAAALAEKVNTPVIFDIDYRPYNWANPDEISVYCALAARSAEIILGSREEFDLCERLTGLSGADEMTAAYWFSQKAKIIVIKHGKEGSSVYCRDGAHYTVKPFPVKLLKSFGGGDGYASAFIYGLLEDKNMAGCLELASASASILVSAHSCSDSMPRLDELQAFIGMYKAAHGECIVEIG